MGKADGGALMKVRFNLCPILLFVPNFLALHTDGNDGFKSDDFRDVIDNQQSHSLGSVRQGAGGYENLQFLDFQTMRKLKVHDPMADDLPLQTKRHGVANDTTLTDRPPAASLGCIDGMKTA